MNLLKIVAISIAMITIGMFNISNLSVASGKIPPLGSSTNTTKTTKTTNTTNTDKDPDFKIMLQEVTVVADAIPPVEIPEDYSTQIINDIERPSSIVPKNAKEPPECPGIKLNTDIPFIGKCIHFGSSNGDKIGQLDAFPYLIAGLMKIIMTIILVVSFILIIAAGVLISTTGLDPKNYSTGITLIKKVAVGIALLGASGVILKVINPNFFV